MGKRTLVALKFTCPVCGDPHLHESPALRMTLVLMRFVRHAGSSSASLMTTRASLTISGVAICIPRLSVEQPRDPASRELEPDGSTRVDRASEQVRS
jgi:hypothetical protein